MTSTVVARQVVTMKSGWNSTVTVGLAHLVQQSATMTSCMMAAIMVINTTFCQYLSSKECDEEHQLSARAGRVRQVRLTVAPPALAACKRYGKLLPRPASPSFWHPCFWLDPVLPDSHHHPQTPHSFHCIENWQCVHCHIQLSRWQRHIALTPVHCDKDLLVIIRCIPH